jgi:hypothetical protein
VFQSEGVSLVATGVVRETALAALDDPAARIVDNKSRRMLVFASRFVLDVLPAALSGREVQWMTLRPIQLTGLFL